MIIPYFLALQVKYVADDEIRYAEKTGTGFVVLPSQKEDFKIIIMISIQNKALAIK